MSSSRAWKRAVNDLARKEEHSDIKLSSSKQCTSIASASQRIGSETHGDPMHVRLFFRFGSDACPPEMLKSTTGGGDGEESFLKSSSHGKTSLEKICFEGITWRVPEVWIGGGSPVSV